MASLARVRLAGRAMVSFPVPISLVFCVLVPYACSASPSFFRLSLPLVRVKGMDGAPSEPRHEAVESRAMLLSPRNHPGRAGAYAFSVFGFEVSVVPLTLY
jgi:hypothetical protein